MDSVLVRKVWLIRVVGQTGRQALMASETYKEPALPKAGVDYGELKRNAMGLPSAFAMSVAFISPTIGIVFISALLASVAGGAAPLAFIVGSLAMACTAYAL